MIRDAVLKVTKTIAAFRAHPRKKYRVPVKIWFEPVENTFNFTAPNTGVFLLGKTSDLSAGGIAFYAPSIRIKEDYLVGQFRILNVELDLAGRKVRMKVVGRRYEQVASDLVTDDRYLVGAEIVEMSGEDRKIYDHFLDHGNKIIKSMAASMELGLD